MLKNTLKLIFIFALCTFILTGCNNNSKNNTIDDINNINSEINDNNIINEIENTSNVKNISISVFGQENLSGNDLDEIKKSREDLYKEEQERLKKLQQEQNKKQRLTKLIEDLNKQFNDINILSKENISNLILGKWRIIHSNENVYNSSYNYIEFFSDYNINLGNVSKGVFSLENNSLVITSQNQTFIDKLTNSNDIDENTNTGYRTNKFFVKVSGKYIELTDITVDGQTTNYYLEAI